MARRTVALIPARGGSKSILLKSLVPLAGRPRIAHVIESARRSRTIDEVICSTDNAAIAAVVESLGVTVVWRPGSLSADDTPMLAVSQHLMVERSDADIRPLIQPTSPFPLPQHINDCVDALRAVRGADCAQTASSAPHNYHAYNQRMVDNGKVRFRFKEERESLYNKQRRSIHFSFGNFIASQRRRSLREMFSAIALGPRSAALPCL